MVEAKRKFKKKKNAQENGHNFGMIKDVFIKFFHDFILNIQNKKWCQLICETPRFSLYCLKIERSVSQEGVQCIIKWPFFEGERGRVGQDGMLNFTRIDMQDCYPI